YTEAAKRAATFIVNAQNTSTGGWRYKPGDRGDTSVLGWQVLALHSAERVGFQIPNNVKRKALRYLDSVSTGDTGVISGYFDLKPSYTMTAEAVFARILLGQQLTDTQIYEASNYVMKQPPGTGRD